MDTHEHGPEWLIDIFEKMGEDPKSKRYVKSKENDVGYFIYTLKKWFDNPARKGIPHIDEKYQKILYASTQYGREARYILILKRYFNSIFVQLG